MKVLKDNKIYVQAKDIAILAESNLDVPQPIVYEIFKDYNYEGGSRTQNLERYICFNSSEAIAFFTALDWIIDYDKVINLSPSECVELLKNNLNKKNELLLALENVRNETTIKKLQDRSIIIDYEEEQLNKIIYSKVNGFDLPYPKETPDISAEEPSKIKRLFNGLMKKIGYKK